MVEVERVGELNVTTVVQWSMDTAEGQQGATYAPCEHCSGETDPAGTAPNDVAYWPPFETVGHWQRSREESRGCPRPDRSFKGNSRSPGV